MTFIASVVAKGGVAIIADSLVSSQETVLHLSIYQKFINEKKRANQKIDPDEIYDLFGTKTAYNRDYEKKLIQYDDYTCITTAGSAYINDLSIHDLIEKIKKVTQTNRFKSRVFEKTLDKLISKLDIEARIHLKKKKSISTTHFYITHYNKSESRTSIIKASINPSSIHHISDPDYELVTVHEESDWPIVCDGQNQISQRILLGDLVAFETIGQVILSNIKNNLAKSGLTPGEGLPIDFFDQPIDLIGGETSDSITKHSQLLNIRELSLHEAVDLATLLMKIEMDFQKYTRLIPTVGGNIMLAIINDKGFKYIHGDQIQDKIH